MENSPSPSPPSHLKEWVRYSSELITQSPEYSLEKAQLTLHQVFSHLGDLEGLRLKSLGLLSKEFHDYCSETASIFGFTISFDSPLKIPFEECSGTISYKIQPNETRHFWSLFMESLLSVYGMKPLSISLQNKTGGESTPFKILPNSRSQESSETEMAHKQEFREFKHSLNNYLGGIISLLSLLEKEMPENEKINLMAESAQNIASLVKGLGKKK